MAEGLKARIAEDTKAAMRARDKRRLGVLRMVNAALKQIEVDERIELDDERVLGALEKMIKQRREAQAQYEQHGSRERAAQEAYEIALIEAYLPEPLDEGEIEQLISEAVAKTGASGVRDMGKVMGALRAPLKGRADMKRVSERVKQRLGG